MKNIYLIFMEKEKTTYIVVLGYKLDYNGMN